MSNGQAFQPNLPQTLDEQIAQLSPAKQALLKLRLQKRGLDAPRQKFTIPKRTSQDLLPLSFAQQRLWVLDQLEPDTASYNMHKSVRLTGPLDVGALEQTLGEIVRRHEPLRTTFSNLDGQPVQVISPAHPLNLAVVDLSELPEPEREDHALALATAEAQRPFDLSRGPLFRTALLRLGRQEHILTLTMHHIISDGWSMGVLYHEIGALYEALSTGRPSPLPDLPIQYADFTLWQRSWLQGQVLDSQVAYWKQQLDGAPPLIEIPTDRPRPSTQSFRGESRFFDLSQTLTGRLKALSRREGATLFMTLLAVFKTLLYRYSGQEDIIVGSPIAGRNQVETERLIGFFVNMLVLRTDMSGNPTFRELLSRVREVALGAYAHPDVPFEKVIEELQIGRSLSYNPLFQVMFVLQNAPMSDFELKGLSFRPLQIDKGASKFDLSLALVERPEGLNGTLTGNSDLYDGITISRILRNYQTLLEGVVADPDRRLSALPLLTEEERHKITVEWNDTRRVYPQNQCVYELFEAQVERTPNAVAVAVEGEQLTYAELNRRANQLAHRLRAFGVGPETLVGIYMERSLEMMVGLLGILKSGGAYVPLDPAYPKERLAFVLGDSAMPVVVTQRQLVQRLHDCKTQVVCLDTNWDFMEEIGENVTGEAAANNLAYVIYTSGSTGRPKGTMIQHRSLVNYTHAAILEYLLGPNDRVLQFASISFDASAEEIFPSLASGAALVLRPDSMLESVSVFLQKCQEWAITVLDLPTVYWHELMERVEAEGLVIPRPLRLVIIGGERALPERLTVWQKRVGQKVRLVNTYGPTEATVVATKCELGRSPGVETLREVPIGRPVQNVQTYLLDRFLQPVPVGIPGELHIGGAGLARGYLKRPELTAEKFIPDPFSDKAGARLYKSGDLARYLPDGSLEFLGRLDQQVKVRGFRVELGEIEAALREHPAVREAAVVAREDEPGEKRLVAYVVPEQKPAPTHAEVRDFLKEKLPDYLLPSALLPLETMPLTPNGKIDRRALPAPDQVRSEPGSAFVAPRDALETQLSKIWEQVLALQSISVEDNFFEIGGHSLLAVRLLARIQKVFNKKIPLATLFQAPTVEQLANVLRQQGWSTTWSSLVPIQPGGSKLPIFCVPGDLGNVFTDLGLLARHLGPDQPFYGLQDGVDNPSRIEDLAAQYVSEVRTVQPQGPYFLAGVCLGGVVAFEMAQQLQAQGQPVALLALIEPSSPPVPGLRLHYAIARGILRRIARRFGHHWRNLSRLGSAEQHAYLRLKSKLFSNMFAFARYAPQTYPDRITLFLASDSLTKSPQDRRLKWGEFAAEGLELQVIPGDHDAITGNNTRIEEAHIRVLAEKLKACIDNTRSALALLVTSLLLQWLSVMSFDFLTFT